MFKEFKEFFTTPFKDEVVLFGYTINVFSKEVISLIHL